MVVSQDVRLVQGEALIKLLKVISNNSSTCANFLSELLKKILIWTIFKVFIEFVTILLLFYVLVFWP